MENSKLTRTQDDKIITGVCGGLAKFFGMDSSVLRIIFALCTVFGIGSPIIIYAILAMIMPNDSYSFE